MLPLNTSRTHMGRKGAESEAGLGKLWACKQTARHSLRMTISVFLSTPIICFPFDGGGWQSPRSLRVAPPGHFHNGSFCLICLIFFPRVDSSFSCFLNGLLPQYCLVGAQAGNEGVFLHAPPSPVVPKPGGSLLAQSPTGPTAGAPTSLSL